MDRFVQMAKTLLLSVENVNWLNVRFKKRIQESPSMRCQAVVRTAISFLVIGLSPEFVVDAEPVGVSLERSHEL
jgi:hypothetical protein